MSEETIQEIKRGPGRPKQISDEQPVKKGKRTWKSASVLDVANKEPGYIYRWARKDPDNLAKKEVEGWETVSGLQSGNTAHKSDRIHDGKKMASTHEKHDAILQRIPEEWIVGDENTEGRNQVLQKETDRRIEGLTAHIKKEAAKQGTDTHGNITISSRQGTQVIE